MKKSLDEIFNTIKPNTPTNTIKNQESKKSLDEIFSSKTVLPKVEETKEIPQKKEVVKPTYAMSGFIPREKEKQITFNDVKETAKGVAQFGKNVKDVVATKEGREQLIYSTVDEGIPLVKKLIYNYNDMFWDRADKVLSKVGADNVFSEEILQNNEARKNIDKKLQDFNTKWDLVYGKSNDQDGFFQKLSGKDGTREMARLFGGQIPIMGAMIAGNVATGGSLAGTFAVSQALTTGSQWGEGLDYAKANNIPITPEYKNRLAKASILTGVMSAGLDTFSFNKLMTPAQTSSLKASFSSALRNKIMDIGLDFGTEASTEALQEIIQNAWATTYDKNRDLFRGTKEAFFTGGILGGITSTIANTYSTLSKSPEFLSTENAIKHSEAINVERTIAQDPAMEKFIYSNPETKTLTPEFASGRIQDVSEKLDLYEKGLGKEMKKVDVKNTTYEEIVNTGLEILSKAENDKTPFGLGEPAVFQSPLLLQNQVMTELKDGKTTNEVVKRVVEGSKTANTPIPREKVENIVENVNTQYNSILEEIKSELNSGLSPEEVAYKVSDEGGDVDTILAFIQKVAKENNITKETEIIPEELPTFDSLEEATTELLTIDDTLFEKTPADIQKQISNLEDNLNIKINQLTQKSESLKSRIANTPNGSNEKKSLKIELSNVQKSIEDAKASYQSELEDQAINYRKFISRYMTQNADRNIPDDVLKTAISRVVENTLDADNIETESSLKEYLDNALTNLATRNTIKTEAKKEEDKIDTKTETNIKKDDEGGFKYEDLSNEEILDRPEINRPDLIQEGSLASQVRDKLLKILKDRGVDFKQDSKPKTQKEIVKESIKTEAKSIKQIAEETKIKEPNIRRILGVGAKEGTFERVEEGVYVLSKDGQDLAYIETGSAIESLPKLADEGFKADMIFLDIPYDTPAVKGGNRGVNYNLISVNDFSKVLDAVKIIAEENTPIIHMFSQAPSGMAKMQKYNDLFTDKGFIPVGRGELQKTFADGSPVTSPNGKVAQPEGILVFTKSGKLNKDLKNLKFKLVRPKGYQTEKPAVMLKAMIEMTTEEGDIVLDPFAGSGVTGAEAVRLGRKAYLIEKNEEVVKNYTKPRVKQAIEEVEVKQPEEIKEEISEFSSINNFSKFQEFFGSVKKGAVNIEEFKKGFDTVVENEKEIKQDLLKKTKGELLKRAGYNVRASDTKADIVDSVFDNILFSFALGKMVSYGLGSNTKINSLKEVVNKTTQTELENYAEESRQREITRGQEIAKVKNAIENPETLEDFKIFFDYKGKEKLTPEQLTKYEDLVALNTKEKTQKTLQNKGNIEGVKTDIDLSIEETTNTKTGEPLFKVKMSDRVERDIYMTLNSKAKSLGGYYSTFAKGFLFKSMEDAENFVKVGKGETIKTDKPEVAEAKRKERAVAKLREVAETLEENATSKLNQDRKTNTARRVNQANSIELQAQKDIAFAKTMKNIASAIESGEAVLLDKINAKTQLETLENILESVSYQEARANNKLDSDGSFIRIPITNKTIDEIKDFYPKMYGKNIYDVALVLKNKKGLARASTNLIKAYQNSNEGIMIFDKKLLEDLITLSNNASKDETGWIIPDVAERYKRLDAIGINSLETLKATLREYIKFKEVASDIDQVKKLERDIVGKKVGVDFFPTPLAVAQNMVDMAQIEVGMKVLEPSAGNGNIADVIRETSPVAPDVAEISGELRKILEAKGHNVIANDFMDITDNYDRIIMNPPFSNNMDIDHIMHAYSLLNEGGKIVAIAGEGAFFRQGKKETAFRNWLEEIGAEVEELPANTFKDTSLLATTGTNARMLVINKVEDAPKFKLSKKKIDKEEKLKLDLSLKTLERLGDRKTVSRQFIQDLVKMQDVKQVERDLILRSLEDFGLDQIDKNTAIDFIDAVRLNKVGGKKFSKKDKITKVDFEIDGRAVAEAWGINPDLDNSKLANALEKYIVEFKDEINVEEFKKAVSTELLPLYRSNRHNFYENIILPSKIRGKVKIYGEHLYNSPIKTSAGNIHYANTGTSDNYFGHTRIEDMEDAYVFDSKAGDFISTGAIRRVIEIQSDLYQKGNLEKEFTSFGTKVDWKGKEYIIDGGNSQFFNLKDEKGIIIQVKREQVTPIISKDIAKLQQYNDPTAHFRMIREEIRKASQDGKTKLQFPTGETAMKIEGLGETHRNWIYTHNKKYKGDYSELKPNNLQEGLEVYDGDSHWIITKVLEDGKFIAIPKRVFNENHPEIKFDNNQDKLSYLRQHNLSILNTWEETFDISGKIDTNNPIYKFYEKVVAKYLINNYGAEKITDKQGVEWVEVAINKQMGEDPVLAYKIVLDDDIRFDRSIEEVKSELARIFGKEIPIETVLSPMALGNPNALARAFKTHIKLLEVNNNLDEAIAKHDAWHWFKMQLSLEERAEIENIELEFAKTNTKDFNKIKEIYKDILFTDKAFAEELMADTFALYHKTGKTVLEKIKVFFEKALFKLKLLFSGRKDVLNMFKNVKYTLEKTKGNNTIFRNTLYKLSDKFPEFNTGDKFEDAKKALEYAEKRNGVKPMELREVKINNKNVELPEEISMKVIQTELLAESLENNPMRELEKYEAKSGLFKGELPEVLGKSKTDLKDSKYYKSYRSPEVLKFIQEGDKIVEGINMNYNTEYSSEEAREEYAKYKADKEKLKMLRNTTKMAVSEFKNMVRDEEFLNRMAVREESKLEETLSQEEKIKKINEIQAKLEKEAEIEFQRNRNIREAKITPVKELSAYQNLIDRPLDPLKYVDKRTQEIFKDWNSKLLKGKVRADDEAQKMIDMPMKKEGLQLIFDYEANVDTKYTERIKKTFDNFFKEARERDVDMGFKENYLPHIYRENPEQIDQAIKKYLREQGLTEEEIIAYQNGEKLPNQMVKTLKLTPFFNKTRVFPTYKVAMEYGLTPKYTNIAQLVGHYVQELETIVANNELLETLESEAKILPFEDAPFTWENVNMPYSQKGYMASPDIANLINGLFGKINPNLWTYGAKISKTLQNIRLSAGIPFTNINFFSIGQLYKELVAGNLKSVNAFWNANFDSNSTKFFKENEKYLYMLARQGIDLRKNTTSWSEIHTEVVSLAGKGFLGGIKTIASEETIVSKTFENAFNKKTFNSFMPMLQVQLFKDSYEAMLRDGIDQETAEQLSSKIIEKNFGLSEFAGRSEVVKNKLSTMFFAPVFRESIINMLANTGVAGYDFVKNLGGLRSPLDPTLVRNRRLLLGMIIVYALYNLLNRALNDDQDLWENPQNRKFALRIPLDDGSIIYVEYMPSTLAFARNMANGFISLGTGDLRNAFQKFGTLMSMPLSLGMQLITGKDYFGNDIYKEYDSGFTKSLKLARHLGLNVSHPYISETINQIQDKKPLYQSVITAMELPLKFSTQDKEDKQEYYQAIDKKSEENSRLKSKVDETYKEIQELKKQNKIVEANKLYEELTDDEKIIYTRIRENPYDVSQRKDDAIDKAIKLIEEGNDQGAVERDIAFDLYGDDYTASNLTTIKKDIAFIRTFGRKNDLANGLKKATSNQEKVIWLNKANKELSKEEFIEFFNNGRKFITTSTGRSSRLLISDELKELYIKQNND